MAYGKGNISEGGIDIGMPDDSKLMLFNVGFSGDSGNYEPLYKTKALDVDDYNVYHMYEYRQNSSSSYTYKCEVFNFGGIRTLMLYIPSITHGRSMVSVGDYFYVKATNAELKRYSKQSLQYISKGSGSYGYMGLLRYKNKLLLYSANNISEINQSTLLPVSPCKINIDVSTYGDIYAITVVGSDLYVFTRHQNSNDGFLQHYDSNYNKVKTVILPVISPSYAFYKAYSTDGNHIYVVTTNGDRNLKKYDMSGTLVYSVYTSIVGDDFNISNLNDNELVIITGSGLEVRRKSDGVKMYERYGGTAIVSNEVYGQKACTIERSVNIIKEV